ncbi:MAG: PKD domain-containing protein [Oscillospiraceae bacterium]|nr:PKD domain-containing protein [Oscillospiraceae bacterium]
MRNITNKIISCALSVFMLGEVFIQNAEPFLRLPLTVSAEEISAAADAENADAENTAEAAQQAETEAQPAPEQDAAEPEETAEEEPAVEYEDLVISGTTETITVPREVGNLTISGRNSSLVLPEQNSNLTVHGNVEMTNGATLTIDKGSLTCEDFTIADGYYGVTVHMQNANSRLTVNGNFTHKSGTMSSYSMKEGVIAVKGDFVSQTSAFSPASDVTVILNGADAQKVTMSEGRFSTLEIRNSSEEGVYSDYPIPAERFTGNLAQLHIGIGGECSLKLTADQEIEGDYMLSSGELDLNGHTLTVGGNLIHAGGAVNLHGGTLHVKGDYLMACPKLNTEPVVYDQGSEGSLIMTDENDALNIDGDLIVRIKRAQTEITAGTMTVKGDLSINRAKCSEFRTSGTHKTVLAGETSHSITGENAAFYFANLALGSETLTACNSCHVTGTLSGEGCTMESGSVTLDRGAAVPAAFGGNVLFSYNYILAQDMHIKGNAATSLHNSSAVQNMIPKGYTLTVDGDFTVNRSLNFGGILNVGGNLTAGNNDGTLTLNDADAQTNVKGSLSFNAGQYNSVTVNKGRLTVGGDLTVEKAAVSVGTAGVLELNGTKQQTLKILNTNSLINNAVFSNTSKEGILIVGTPLIVETEIAEGCAVKYEGGGQLGYTLEEDTVLDSLYMVGGNLDLNGHTLTVKGDFIQSSGRVLVNGGTLDVKGNYKIAAKNTANGTLTYDGASSGTLIMKNADDKVIIGKNFETYASRSHSTFLTAGVMTITGDFLQSGSSSSFAASGTHKVVFTDGDTHDITFASTGSRFCNLELGEARFNVKNVGFTGALSGDNCITSDYIMSFGSDLDVRGDFGGSVNLPNSSTVNLKHDVHIKGNFSTSAYLYLKSYTLKVDGEFRHAAHSVYFNTGTLDCGSFYRNYGYQMTVTMDQPAAVLRCRGDFTYLNSSRERLIASFSAGTVYIGGDFTINANFKSSGTNKFIFNGDRKQVIDMQSNDCALEKVFFSNTSEEGIEVKGSLPVTEIERTTDSPVIFESGKHAGETLTADQEIEGDYELIAGQLDLNGHTMHITGNLIHTAGRIEINNGTLIVDGNYNLASGVQNGETVSYTGVSRGLLAMDNAKDSVQIGGDFIVNAANSHEALLTAGVMTIKGNFKNVSSDRAFTMGGNHKVVFTGDTEHEISTVRYANIRFRNVDFGSETVRADNCVQVAGVLSGDHNTTIGIGSNAEEQSLRLLNTASVAEGYIGNIRYVGSTVILKQDMHIAGDLYMYGLDLDQYTLTVDGSFYPTSTTVNIKKGKLIVKGDFIRTYDYALLYMQFPEGEIIVNGNFSFNNSTSSYRNSLTAGKITVGGDFSVNNAYFCPTGTHQVVFNGNQKQTIHFATAESGLNKAVFSNTSEEGIVIEGALNVNEIENTTDCKVTCSDGVMGSKLTGDMEISGDCYMIGGNFDLNGYTLKVGGSLIQAGGKITVNGGSLEVGRDYLLASKKVSGETVTYDAASSGMLIMTNPEDRVHVKGSFVSRTNQSHRDSLTDGVMTVEGDYELLSSNFAMTGNHTMVFSGTEPQVIRSGCTFQNVVFENTGSTKLNRVCNVNGTLTDRTQRVTGTATQYVYLQNPQQIQGGVFSGYVFLPNTTIPHELKEDLTLGGMTLAGTLYLRTYKLTVKSFALTGTLNMNAGTLETADDFSFSSNSKVIMQNPAAKLWVGGDLLMSSGTSTAGNLTAGQIEVKGDLIQSGTGSFITSKDCVVILSGTGSYYGRSIVQSIRLKNADSRFAFVQFSRPLSEYRFYRNDKPVAVDDGNRDFFDDFKIEYSDTEAPSKVTGLKTVGASTTTISLIWEPSTDDVAVFGYEVYRNQEKIFTTSETSFTDSALSPETAYSYEVIAFDACRNFSEASGSVTGKTLADTTAPAVPKDLRVLGRSATAVKLAWNAARDNLKTVGYRIYSGETLAADVTDGLSAKISDLESGKTYTFTVKAYDLAGNESEAGESVSVTPQIPQVESISPKDRSDLGGTQSDLTFAFTNLGGRDAVSVQMDYKAAGEDDDAYQPVSGSLRSITITPTLIYHRYRWSTKGLHGDYFLRITLTDEDGTSSTHVTEYLIDASAPEAPKNLLALPQNGTVDLQWDPSASANCGGYFVFRAAPGSDEFVKIAKIDSAVNVRYVDKDVTAGETYRYQVSAVSRYDIEGEPCKAVSVEVTADELAPDITAVTPEKSRINGTQTFRVKAEDNLGVTRIVLSWHNEEDADELWNELPETAVQDGSCEVKWDTAALPDGAYRIRAYAYDAKGNKSAHFDKLYEIDNSGPEQVVVDTGTTTAAASFISLRWTDIEEPNFGCYAVEQLEADGSYKEVGRTSDTAGMHIEGLLAETEYTFRVVAYDDLGNRGTYSEPVTLKTTADTFAPGISAFYPAGSSFNEKIDLSVTAADNIAVEALTLRYATETGENKIWKDLTTLTADAPRAKYEFKYSFDVTALTEGMVYVEAVAHDTAGLASEPVIAEYRIDRTAPAAITDLNADGKNGNVHLTWTVSDNDIKGFEIFRAEDGKSQLRKIADCTTKDYYDITISFDTIYTYQIFAVDVAGNRSEASNTAIVQAIPDTENPVVLGFVPATGSTVGANPNISVVVRDNNRLANVTVYYQEAGDKSGLWQEIGSCKLDSNYQSASFRWDTADLKDGDYRMKAVATDMSGNVSDPEAASFAEFKLMATAPDAPVLELTQENWQLRLAWTANKNKDFYGYKLFRKTDADKDYTWINQNDSVSESYIDTDVEPGTVYEYMVAIYDQWGNHTESNVMRGFAYDKDTVGPKVSLPENMQVLTGAEVLFDGTDTTDNVRASEFYWEFGDGETGVGSRIFHKFAKAGTYTVYLTAKDAAGNSGRGKTVVTVLDPSKYGSVELTAVDQDNNPLKFAYVFLRAKEGGKDTETALKTNSEGKVLISRPLGDYEVSVYKQGYLPQKDIIRINEVSVTKQQRITVNSGELVTGSLTVHRMSLEEMIEAGVDFNDPANSHSFRYDIELTFAQEPIPTVIQYISSGGGGGGGGFGGGGGWGGGGGGGGSCTLSDGSHVQVQTIVLETDEEEEVPPILAYVRTSESISFLKDMYAVDLGVLNNATSDFTIVNSKARLELPHGLSLASTTKHNNNLTQYMGDIPGKQQATASWTVRGDKKGEYDVSADFSGTLMPFNAPVYASFKTEHPFTVTVGSGLHLYIYPEEIGYIGENYYIQYALVNEGNDTIYQLETSFPQAREPEQKSKVIVIDPEGFKEMHKEEIPGYVLTDVPNKCQIVPVIYGKQRLNIGMFFPGDAIYGTYVTTFHGEGDKSKVRYRLIDHLVKGLEDTDIQVTVSPIPSHITRYNVQLEIVPNMWGDPVDMTTGAFTDEAEALVVQGAASPLAFDLHYNSLASGACGSVGYGWSHDYETYLEPKGSVVDVHWDSTHYASFLSRSAMEDEVYGNVLPTGMVQLDSMDRGGYREYLPISGGMEGFILCRELDNTFTLEKPDGSKVYFDADGRMTQIKSDKGQTVSLSRAGNATTVTEDVSGASITFITNDAGLVTTVRDAGGRTAVLAYDEGRLISVTNAAGDKVNYAYDEQGRLTSAAVEGEKTPYVINEYDESNRVTKQYDGVGNASVYSFTEDEDFNTVGVCTDREGNTVKFVSDSTGRTTSITDQNGHKTSYVYDTRGNLLAETNAKGDTRRFTYDADNNLTKLYDYEGNVTEMLYDTKGNITEVYGPDGEQSSYTYNGANLLTETIENTGIRRTYTYNADGQRLTESVTGLGVTYYDYENGRMTGVTDFLKNKQTIVYDEYGNVHSETDAAGSETVYTYDAIGRVISMTNADGTTSYTYDARGNQTSVTDPSGGTTTFIYNGNNKIVKSIDAAGAETVFTYDKEDRLVKTLFADGTTEENTYDGVGNIIRSVSSGSAVTEYTYDKVDQVIEQRVISGDEVRKTAFSYLANGKLSDTVYPDGSTEHCEYDLAGRLISVTTGTGSKTVMTYDKAGNLLTSADALGNETAYAYDEFGRVTKMTDPNGNVTTYDAYDANGNCLRTTLPNGLVVTHSYDKLGRLVKSVTGDISVLYGYDAAGRVTSYTDAEGHVFTMQYDANGNTVSVTDADGNKIQQNTYDERNQLIKTADVLGVETEYTYNNVGQLMKTVENLNTTREKTTAFSYDKAGRMLSSKDAEGGTASYEYDGFGSVAVMVDPNGGRTQYTYDSMGRTLSVLNAIGSKNTYSYNADGLLETAVNARGQETTYTYLKNGWLESFTDSLGTVSYTYDANGNVLTVTDKNGTVTREYNAMNQVTRYTDFRGQTVEYAYDQLGNLITLTYPGGRIVKYSYYKDGSVKSVTDWENRTTSYEYDNNGRLTKTTRPDGSVETRGYDKAGRLIRQEDVNGDIIINVCDYSYDEAGNITSVSMSNGTEFSSLTNAEMEYDAANRLIKYNGEAVRYDADGNMIYGPVNGVMSELTYDCRNRLLSAGGVTYSYDAENNRISMTNGDSTTYFAYDTVAQISRVLTAETDGKTVYYVYGTGLVSQEDDENLLYYHFNNLGSTQALTTIDGEIADTFEYGPYGELTSQNKYGIMFLYNGEYGVATDANGLYYMRARYYNPEIKRFINQDVIIGEIANTPSMNRYAYVQGNPISYVDPFGLSPGLGWKFWGHLALNLLGMLTLIPTPVTFAIGAIANLANGIWYAAEGDYYSAVSCAVSILGGGFKLLDVAGQAGKLSGAMCTLHQVLKYTSAAGDIALGAYDMYRVGKKVYDKASKGELTFGDILSAGFQVGMDSMQIVGGINTLGNKVRYCFVAGTPVETEDGQKPIEEIEAGDQVLSQDPVTGDVAYKTVLETSVNESTELVHIFVGENESEIVTTPPHPFYVAQFGWTAAVNLRAGDVLVLSNGEYVVVERVQHEILESPVKVYNFEVEDYHTYFVGDEPVLVHNGTGQGCGVPKANSADAAVDAAEEGQQQVKRMNVSSAGHHVPSVRKSKGRSFQLSRGNKSRPTFHFPGSDPGHDHWRLHEAEKLTVGKRQGDFIGTNQELMEAYKKAYAPLGDIKIDVKSPDGKTILGLGVTPEEGVDLMIEYLTKKGLM